MSEDNNYYDFSFEGCQCSCGNKNLIGICINKKCQDKGPHCYPCIFDYHNSHCSDCIPIEKVQYQSVSSKEIGDIIKEFREFLNKKMEEFQIFYNDQLSLLDKLEHFSFDLIDDISLLNLWLGIRKKEGKYKLSKETIILCFENKCKSLLKDILDNSTQLFSNESFEQFKDSKISLYKFNLFQNENEKKLYENNNKKEDVLYFSPLEDNTIITGIGICPRIKNEFNYNEEDNTIILNIENEKKTETLYVIPIPSECKQEDGFCYVPFKAKQKLIKGQIYSIFVKYANIGTYIIKCGKQKEKRGFELYYNAKNVYNEEINNTFFFTNNSMNSSRMFGLNNNNFGEAREFKVKNSPGKFMIGFIKYYYK